MERQHRFIDADGHVIEPEDIWENYLEPGFRSEMPFTRFKYAGNPLTITEEIRVAGDVLPASAAAGAAYCRAYNNWVRDFCVETHGRVIGAGCLDLRDVDAAIKEARRCVKELGMKALRI